MRRQNQQKQSVAELQKEFGQIEKQIREFAHVPDPPAPSYDAYMRLLAKRLIIVQMVAR